MRRRLGYRKCRDRKRKRCGRTEVVGKRTVNGEYVVVYSVEVGDLVKIRPRVEEGTAAAGLTTKEMLR
jgi:hypothetical protein